METRGLSAGLAHAPLGRAFAPISLSTRVGFPCVGDGCRLVFIPVVDTVEAIQRASQQRRTHALDEHGITMPVYAPPLKWANSRATVHRWMEDGKRARREKEMGYSG